MNKTKDSSNVTRSNDDKDVFDEKEIIDNIDSALLNTLFYDVSKGVYKPYVCVSCDRYLGTENIQYIKEDSLINCRNLLMPVREIPQAILDYYSYVEKFANSALDKCLLSSKSCVKIERNVIKYAICSSCKYSLLIKKEVPQFAICNHFEIGKPPTELEVLTDVELAFVSPVSCHTHLFTFSGGHKGMKGFHSLIKTNIIRTRECLEQMDRLDEIPNKIVVILHAQLTDEQKSFIKNKCVIRRDICKTAIDWLLNNNQLFMKDKESLNLDILPDPLIVDHSEPIEQCDGNVESQMDFTVVFPDSTLDSQNGGYENVDQFKRTVGNVFDTSRFNAELKIPNSKFVRDFEDNNFVKAFPRHFPYGLGGPEEKRYLSSDGSKGVIQREDYIHHITNLAHLRFHEALFILVNFNILQRQRMLNNVQWRLKSNKEACDRISEMNPDDLIKEIEHRLNNNYSLSNSNGTAVNFLNLLSAMTRSLPHTNEAAKQGRRNVINMQIEFGFPHIFFTISPPDDNSLIICTYGGIQNMPKDPFEMTEEELISLSKERTYMKLQYPGLSTLNFECILTVVLKHVIGWNNVNAGIFGTPEAYYFAVEEQARKVLHAHFLVWIKDLPFNHSKIAQFRPSRKEILKCTNYVDKVTSNFLIGDRLEKKIITHTPNCSSSSTKPIIIMKENQALRHVRHRDACRLYNGAIACCRICNTEFSSDDIALSVAIKNCFNDETRESFVINLNGEQNNNVRNDQHIINYNSEYNYPETMNDNIRNTHNMVNYNSRYNYRVKENEIVDQTNILNYDTLSKKSSDESIKELRKKQKYFLNEVIFQSKFPQHKNKVVDTIVNGLYNCHSTFHVRTCFSNDRYECRYLIPQQSRKRTAVVNFDEEDDWYLFTGKKNKRKRIEIVPKRGLYDVAMNNYCPLVSKTKIACNSNISIVTNGVQGFYCSKYTSKSTQEEDAKPYEKTIKYVQRRMLIQKFENTQSESMSRLTSASFAHNSKNVISSTLAKFLINNSSRFGYSHKFAYIPIRELKSIINSRAIDMVIQTCESTLSNGRTTTNAFLCGTALHYIYRPDELEDISSYEFYTEYEIVRRTSKTQKDSVIYELQKNHPGYKYLIVRNRVNNCIAGLNNWEFSDAICFEGDILDKMNEPKDSIQMLIEDYALTVLILARPFRTRVDLNINDSYLLMLREVFENLDSKIITKLQNIQDIRNAIRNKGKRIDELANNTEAFQGEYDNEEMNSDVEENENIDGIAYFINKLELQQENDDEEIIDVEQLTNEPCTSDDDLFPTSLDLTLQRDKGAHNCGYSNLIDIDVQTEDCLVEVVESSLTALQENTEHDDINGSSPVELSCLYELLVSSITRIVSHDEVNHIGNIPNIVNNNSVENNANPVAFKKILATGTAESLKAWSRENKFDKNQRKAFLILGSIFVLTYINDVEVNNPSTNNIGQKIKMFSTLRIEKKKLLRLSLNKPQVRMFLDGAGGSGKSEVIKQLLIYARSFCSQLGVPFTKHTILITASTGVAATLINGSTLHSATYLNQKTEITEDQRKLFQEVRMLIIDEISMIDIKTLQNLDKKLRDLKESRGDYYGGINVLFVGDFRQLDPVKSSSKPIYKDLLCHEWMDAVNVYIELKGNYRFIEDPEWGMILQRFRDGVPLPSDFENINKRLINNYGYTMEGDSVPNDVAYATPYNKERDAINTGLFCKAVDLNTSKCIILVSDQLGVKLKNKDAKYVPFRNKKMFWETCGEDDCKFPNQTRRIDPLLKLYLGCPLMMTENLDVDKQQANGAIGILEKVFVKSEKCLFSIVINGKNVLAVMASNVAYIKLRLENKKSLQLEPKRMTNIKVNFPQPDTFRTKKASKITLTMQACQIPVVANHATTGHKLQGVTKRNLLVNSFSYNKNWPYVVLSRVKTRRGLFLRNPLNPSKDYSVDPSLLKMITMFRISKVPPDDIFQD